MAFTWWDLGRAPHLRLGEAWANMIHTSDGSIPKEPGFGDYVIMDIDAEGRISGWVWIDC